jgi:predicted O-methyltransferase YrrM
LEIILPLAQEYSEKITSAENELLKEISDFTFAHHAQPHMLSGQVQGRLLAAMSRMISPTWILEIGTFTGYSALCLAEGLEPGGQLHTLEKNPDDVKLSKNYFERSP